MTEIPFLPVTLPNRPLTSQDLDWRPVLLAPETPRAFEPSPDALDQLQKLPRQPGAVFEFDSMHVPGASFIENGRPCFGRVSLLVETSRGLILSSEIHSGAIPSAEAAGRGLMKGP